MPDLEVVSFTPGPSTEVTELLEGILERARKGEVRSVGVCMEISNGAVATVYTAGEHGDTNRLLAASTRLQNRIRTLE